MEGKTVNMNSFETYAMKSYMYQNPQEKVRNQDKL